jgi:hypothetical protein
LKYKRILKVLLLSILAIIIFAGGFLYFNKNKIVKEVISQIEEQTNSTILYGDPSMGIDQSFPNLFLAIPELKMTTALDTAIFMSMSSARISMNPWTIIRSKDEIPIKKVSLIDPVVNLKIAEDGSTNWDQFTNSEKDGEKSSKKMVLEEVEIKNGSISYLDQESDLSIFLKESDYYGTIDLSNDTLNQHNTLSFILSSQGLLYNAQELNIKAQTASSYNSSTSTVFIEEGALKVNEVEFDLSGALENMNSTFDYDLFIDSKDQEFGNLLSLIESLNVSDTKELNASGKFSVSGSVKGNANSDHPQYKVNLDTEEGTFFLPDNKSQELFLDVNARVSNSDHSMPYTHIVFEQFSLLRDHEKILGHLEILNENDQLKVDYDLYAKIDDLRNFDAFFASKILGGNIHLLSKGSFDLFENDIFNTDDIVFNVDWEAENLDFYLDSTRVYSSVSEGLGDQKSITINFGKTNYGTSDVRGDIVIIKPLDYLIPDRILKIKSELKSDLLDFNELLSSNQNSEGNSDWIEDVNAQLDFNANNVKYRGYNAKDVKFNCNLVDNRLKIESAEAMIEDSDFKLEGQLNSLSGYVNGTEKLSGTIDLRSDVLDLSQLETIYYDPAYQSSSSSTADPFEEYDIQIISSSKKLVYGDSKLDNSLAHMTVKGNTLKINDFISSSFGGELKVQGDIVMGKDQSIIELKTDFSNISIAQSLEALPIFRKISYPLSFVDGRINTTLSMSSALDTAYQFILPAFNAFALLETLDGKISGFAPLEKLNNILGLNEKKDLIIKNSKNWVSIQDGWVQVEEFRFSIEDYHFRVKGAHSLENELDYTILAEVPSAKISKINIEDFVDPGIIAKLNKYKNTQKGYVGLLFDMKGNFKEPTIKLNEVDVLSAGKAAVEQTIQEVKDSIRSRIDSTRSEIETEVKDTLSDLADAGQDKIGELFDSTKSTVETKVLEKMDSTLLTKIDSLGGGVLKEKMPLDSIKDKIFKLKDIFNRKNSE